jgi:hypothetical protein
MSEMNGDDKVPQKMCLCTDKTTLPITTPSTEEFLESYEA